MRLETANEASTLEDWVRLLSALPAVGHEEAIEAVAALVRSSSPMVRKRALRLGADILPDDLLVAWLRNAADDVVRNAGLEILKLRGGRAFPLALQLARDADPDVVLQAALLLDHYRDPRGIAVLRGLLDLADPNVAQAAILALGHHRDPSIIRDLTPFLDSDPWLQIAAIQALGDLGDPCALPLLEPFLDDEFLESFASESIAHIGGIEAFRILSSRWIASREKSDAERYVALLASVIVNVPRRVSIDSALEDALIEALVAESATLGVAAAKIILACGSTAAEIPALLMLASAEESSADLPPCLSQRDDLVSILLAAGGRQREWGLQLAAVRPGSATAVEIAAAVLKDPLPEHLADACGALVRSTKGDESAAAVIALFGRIPAERRRDLHAAIAAHGPAIRTAIARRGGPLSTDETILAILAGADAADAVPRIAALTDSARSEVVLQVLPRGDVIRALPWERWVEEDPSTYGGLLAEAVIETNFDEAGPLLRAAARKVPSARVVEALGLFRDEADVGFLEELLTGSNGRMRAFVCTALGAIGGERVRSHFRRVASTLSPSDAKFAYRAWAKCAQREDVPDFRAVASHDDWLVRAAAAEVLARYPDPSSFTALTALALDPVEAVAAKALATGMRNLV